MDLYHLPHGYWEAKDEKDDLAREVERKLDKGYPRDNIIVKMIRSTSCGSSARSSPSALKP